MNTIKRALMALVSLWMLTTTTVYAGAAAGGASEVTQVLQMVTDILDRALSYKRQLSELKAKMKMISKYTKSITNPHTFKDVVKGAEELYKGTRDLIYSAANISNRFKHDYKDFSTWKADIKGDRMDYNKTYNDMAEELERNTMFTLESINKNFKYYKNQHQLVMDQLNTMNENPEGQTRAIQATNEILMHLTNIMTRMHETLLHQSSLQSQYMQVKTTKGEIDKAHTAANHDIAPFSSSASPMPDH